MLTVREKYDESFPDMQRNRQALLWPNCSLVYTGQMRTTSFSTFEDDGYLSLNLGCENDNQISI